MRILINLTGISILAYYLVSLTYWIYTSYGVWGLIGALAFSPVAYPVFGIFMFFQFFWFSLITLGLGYIFLTWGHNGN